MSERREFCHPDTDHQLERDRRQVWLPRWQASCPTCLDPFRLRSGPTPEGSPHLREPNQRAVLYHRGKSRDAAYQCSGCVFGVSFSTIRFVASFWKYVVSRGEARGQQSWLAGEMSGFAQSTLSRGFAPTWTCRSKVLSILPMAWVGGIACRLNEPKQETCRGSGYGGSLAKRINQTGKMYSERLNF